MSKNYSVVPYRNILVQYKGGGYDGCFWEWNYFIIDDLCEFHSIIASGRKGIEDRSEAMKLLTSHPEQGHGRQAYYTYPLTEEGLKEFAIESNASHVIAVASYLFEHYGIIVKTECEECGRTIDVLESYESNFRGYGGLSYAAQDLICSDCEYEREFCQDCDEIISDCMCHEWLDDEWLAGDEWDED